MCMDTRISPADSVMTGDTGSGADPSGSGETMSEPDLASQLAEVATELADLDAKISELQEWRRLLT